MCTREPRLVLLWLLIGWKMALELWTNDWVKYRRRNTRYKNPQLVAQHCFVASFGRCFAFFTLRDQLDPQQKYLWRVEEMQRADWLICQYTSTFVARQVVSMMKNAQQSQNLLLRVDQRSTFRNNFLERATNVFVARQDDHARRKTGNIDPNSQRNNVDAPSWGFLYLVFRRLKAKLK